MFRLQPFRASHRFRHSLSFGRFAGLSFKGESGCVRSLVIVRYLLIHALPGGELRMFEGGASISGDIHGTAVNHKLLKVKGLRDRKSA